MAIERKEIFTFRYFEYGEAFHGSYQGMRYQVARNPLVRVFGKSEEEKADGTIEAVVWPEPFCYDKTPEEKKIRKEFSFSETGVDMAVEWLNEQYESGDFHAEH